MNFSGTFPLTLILSLVKKERSGLFTLTPALSPRGKGAYGERSVTGKERARIIDPGPCWDHAFKDDYLSSSSS